VELELPLVFVTLVSRAGYFRQEIDAEGSQVEAPGSLGAGALVHPTARDGRRGDRGIHGLDPAVALCPERGHGRDILILLLDTDLDQNRPDDRRLTDALWGDESYRLKQEIVHPRLRS
jgi:glycogen phosphorylase